MLYERHTMAGGDQPAHARGAFHTIPPTRIGHNSIAHASGTHKPRDDTRPTHPHTHLVEQLGVRRLRLRELARRAYRGRARGCVPPPPARPWDTCALLQARMAAACAPRGGGGGSGGATHPQMPAPRPRARPRRRARAPPPPHARSRAPAPSWTRCGPRARARGRARPRTPAAHPQRASTPRQACRGQNQIKITSNKIKPKTKQIKTKQNNIKTVSVPRYTQKLGSISAHA